MAVDVPSFAVRVTQQADGMFPMAAAATDSAVFEGPATLAQLWASLPDLPAAPRFTGAELRPLYLEAVTLVRQQVNLIEYLAPKRARFSSPLPFRTFDPETGERIEGEALLDEARRALDGYPTATEAVVEMAEVVGQFGHENVPTIRFPDGEGAFRNLFDVGDSLPSSADGSRSFKHYVLRPKIGDVAATPPSQLVTLWAFVYGVSQLARYHPDLWVGALDPDRSEIAVDLEYVLDAALTLVPDLLVPAVSNGAMPRLVREHEAAQRARERLQEAQDAEEPEAAGP